MFYAEVYRSLAILVSNVCYVPILFMFVMAFLRPYESSASSTTRHFVVLAVIAGTPVAAGFIFRRYHYAGVRERKLCKVGVGPSRLAEVQAE